jgi:hypothetical protein
LKTREEGNIERGRGVHGWTLCSSCLSRARYRGERDQGRGEQQGCNTELRAMGVPIYRRGRQEMKGNGGERKGQPSCFNSYMSYS